MLWLEIWDKNMVFQVEQAPEERIVEILKNKL